MPIKGHTRFARVVPKKIKGPADMPIKGYTGFAVVQVYFGSTNVLVQVIMRIILNMLQSA